jgi:maltose O-acetyltransferase
MPSEKSKMLAGELYDARDAELSADRRRAHALREAFNGGDDVWIGGGSVICPGVRVGNGSLIGAGSVVTRDIPAGAVAAGNPCRVIRAIEAA